MKYTDLVAQLASEYPTLSEGRVGLSIHEAHEQIFGMLAGADILDVTAATARERCELARTFFGSTASDQEFTPRVAGAF